MLTISVNALKAAAPNTPQVVKDLILTMRIRLREAWSAADDEEKVRLMMWINASTLIAPEDTAAEGLPRAYLVESIP